MCFQCSKYANFMSLGRSFRESMTVLCPLQITVMGPSTKDVSDKDVKQKRLPF